MPIAMFFDRERERGLVPVLCVAALYVTGLVGWAYVMGWGATPLDFHDWSGINIPRLMFLQNALRAGDVPLHMQGGEALHHVTDRFLALPDVITSPQTLLLTWMPVKAFVLVDVLIQYSIGFAAMLCLRRYLQWSLFAFTAAFAVVMFNGHILAHYSVGHFSWGGYFAFPFVALLVLRFLDGHASRRSIAAFAGVMFYMVLSGGQHHLTWVLLLLVLLMPFCRERAGWLAAVVMASGAISAVRLLPPALEVSSFRNAGLVGDVIGFPSVAHLIESLVWLRRAVPAYDPTLPGNLTFFDSAFYEFNAYIGVVAFTGLVAGVCWWLRTPSRHHAMIAPLAILIALSIGSVYRLVRATGIPLLESERYTGRLFILPLLFLMVFAVTAIDRRLKSASATARGIALAGLAFVAIDIAGSVRLWRVSISQGVFGAAPFDPAEAAVVHRDDPVYVNVILAGLIVTAVTAIALAVLAYRERAVIRSQAS